MTTRVTAIAAAGLLGLAAAGCGGSSSSGGTVSGCGGSGDITIGLIGPLSGAVAQIAGSFSRGGDQAVKDVNAAGGVCGGRHLTYVAEDNAGDATKDGQLARILVEQKHAAGVVMVSDDDFAVAGQYLRQQHVLAVCACVGDSFDDPANSPIAVSDAIPNRLESQVWKQYLLTGAHIKRPAVVYETVTAYGRAQSTAFCNDAQANGTPCVAQEQTTLDTTDVSTQVSDILGHHADGVLLEGFGLPVIKTIGTLRAGGFTGPILGTATTATSANLIASFVPAPALQGYVYVSYRSAVQADPGAALGLAAKLKATSPITEPLFVPMFSYDAVQLMARGFTDARSLRGEDAARALEKLDARQNPSSGPFYLHDYQFSAQHHIAQVDGWLALCSPKPLDDNGLAPRWALQQ